MDDRKTDLSADRLPAGIPSEVRLLDHNWLTDQRKGGARLTLLDPTDGGRDADLTVARSLLEAERAEADRLRDSEAASRRQLEEVEAALDQLVGETDALRAHGANGDRKVGNARAALVSLVSEAEELRRRVEELEGELRVAHERDPEHRSVEAAMSSLQFEAWELQNALDRAQRPLWKKLLRRS